MMNEGKHTPVGLGYCQVCHHYGSDCIGEGAPPGYYRPEAAERDRLRESNAELLAALQRCADTMRAETNERGHWIGGGPGSFFRDALNAASAAIEKATSIG